MNPIKPLPQTRAPAGILHDSTVIRRRLVRAALGRWFRAAVSYTGRRQLLKDMPGALPCGDVVLRQQISKEG